MDPNAKFGNTNPVRNCAAHHGIPDWVAFATADVMIHGPREDHTQAEARAWLREKGLWPVKVDAPDGTFFRDMAMICARAFPADRQ